MTQTCRFLQVFALGIWLGGIILLSFVVAPGAFSILMNPDQAGDIVGFVLSRVHTIGMILGIVYLVATIGTARSFSAIVRPAAMAVVLMVLLTFVSETVVIKRMHRLRMEMGSVDATPVNSPLRRQFERLHPISVDIEGAVLLLGIAALFLTVRVKPL